MRSRRALPLSLALVVGACAEGPRFVPLPFTGEARSAILVVEDGRIAAVGAGDTPFRLDLREDVAVVAHLYRAELDALGLDEGPQEQGERTTGLRLPLPDAARALDAETASWIDTPLPDPLVLRDRRNEGRCARFRVDQQTSLGFRIPPIQTPGAPSAARIAALGPRRAGFMFIEEGACCSSYLLEPTSMTATTTPFRFDAASPLGDGSFLVARFDLLRGMAPGILANGPPSGTVLAAADQAFVLFARDPNEVGGPAPVAGSERVAAVDQSSRVAISTPRGGGRLQELPGTHLGPVALAFDGERAFLVIRGEQSVVWVVGPDGGRPESPGAPVTTVLNVPSIGTLAGTGLGQVLVRGADGSWAPLAGFAAGYEINALFPGEGGGFFAVTAGGTLVQYRPEVGMCPPIQFAPVLDTVFAQPIGRDVAVVGRGVATMAGESAPWIARYLERLD